MKTLTEKEAIVLICLVGLFIGIYRHDHFDDEPVRNFEFYSMQSIVAAGITGMDGGMILDGYIRKDRE